MLLQTILVMMILISLFYQFDAYDFYTITGHGIHQETLKVNI